MTPEERRALRDRAHTVLADEAGATALGRACPRCGASAHGRPWARAAGRPLHVSLSYAEGLVLVAWSTTHPLGVDVTPDHEHAAAWAAAEAVLKLTGEGIHGDPSVVPPGIAVGPLRAPAGHVAQLASAVPAEVSWRWAGPGARSRRARP